MMASSACSKTFLGICRLNRRLYFERCTSWIQIEDSKPNTKGGYFNSLKESDFCDLELIVDLIISEKCHPSENIEEVFGSQVYISVLSCLVVLGKGVSLSGSYTHLVGIKSSWWEFCRTKCNSIQEGQMNAALTKGTKNVTFISLHNIQSTNSHPHTTDNEKYNPPTAPSTGAASVNSTNYRAKRFLENNDIHP